MQDVLTPVSRNLSVYRRDVTSFDRGDISFIIVSMAMIFLMVPGLAFLYAGLARRKNALSLMLAVFASNAVMTFQWCFWGYSLAFSRSATNGFIGNMKNFGLMGTFGGASPGSPLIPELLYSGLQMEFASVTAGILVGAIAERGRALPAMAVIFLWATFVYCPLAYWTWGANGWAMKWGVLDFSGGGAVEIGSGFAGLAYAWILGPRQKKELVNFRPYSVSMVVLGTSLLWFGWIAFNGGTAFGANLRAVVAAWNSMITGAFGGVAWCLVDYRAKRRFSMVSMCSGIIAGLVASTPSSGYVPLWSSIIIGLTAGGLCNLATKLKVIMHVDDTLDIFAQHGIGGVIGLFFNALFARQSIIALDGVNTSIRGGWIDQNWKQMYIQLVYIGVACAYTFIVTAIIAKCVDVIPGLHLRSTHEAERLGMDEVEIGEFAHDLVELRREFAQGPHPVDGKGLFRPHISAGGRLGHVEVRFKDLMNSRSNSLILLPEKTYNDATTVT